MPDIKLYNSAGSTCSQRVRFTLAAKELPFEKHDLNLLGGDQLKPEYLAINPNGVVPTLVYDGTTVTDSSVIIEFLDEMHHDVAPLVPDDPGRRAAMRSLMRYIDEVPTAAVRYPSFNVAFIKSFKNMTDDEFRAIADSKPLRKEFMNTMGREGFSDDEITQALDRLGRSMKRMNAEIGKSGGPWMLGADITLADIAIMPTVVRLDDIGLNSLWAGMPAVDTWLDNIRANPAFDATYYPGAHISERWPEVRKWYAKVA